MNKKKKRCLSWKIIKSVYLIKNQCLYHNKSLKARIMKYTRKNINKIALSSNDDKRIVALDGISSYPYGYCGED